MRWLTLITFIVIIVSCSSETDVPRGIIKIQEMKAVVFDLLRAEEFVNSYVFKDSTKDKKIETIKMYEQVFLIHKVSKADFFVSYKYYQEHPDKNKIMFDSLYNLVNAKKNYDTIKPAKIAQ